MSDITCTCLKQANSKSYCFLLIFTAEVGVVQKWTLLPKMSWKPQYLRCRLSGCHIPNYRSFNFVPAVFDDLSVAYVVFEPSVKVSPLCIVARDAFI